MTQLVWNPQWHHPHESMWSVLFKVAFASQVSPAALAGRWMEDAQRRRISATLPTAMDAVRTCEALHLGASTSQDLFADIWDGTLQQRERYQLRMRWCPECAKSWFHSPLFQQWRRSRCPWHGVPLIDSCPKCGRIADPLAESPWKCMHCGLEHAPRTDWLALFKRPIDALSSTPRNWFRHSEDAVLPGGSVEYRLLETGDAQRESPAEDFMRHHRWLAGIAFEEASALLDSLLGEHRACVEGESMMSLTQYQVVDFRCPVAAAAVFVAVLAGAETEALRRWPPHGKSGYTSQISVDIAAVVHRAPTWLCPMLVREFVRSALLKGLRLFTGLAEDGRRSLVWRNFNVPPASWQLKDCDLVLVRPAVTTEELCAAVLAAGAMCPNVEAVTNT